MNVTQRPVSPSEIVRALARPLPTTPRAAVIVTAATGRICFWNRAAEQLLGWSAREVMQRRIHELGPRHVQERTYETLALAQAEGAVSGDTTLWRRTGVPIACYSLIIVLGDVARGRGVIVGANVAASQRSRLKRDGARIRAELCRRLKLVPPKPCLSRFSGRMSAPAERRANHAQYGRGAEPMRLARTLGRQPGAADPWSRMQTVEACRYQAEWGASDLAGPRARRAAAVWLRAADQLYAAGRSSAGRSLTATACAARPTSG